MSARNSATVGLSALDALRANLDLARSAFIRGTEDGMEAETLAGLRLLEMAIDSAEELAREKEPAT